MQSLFIELGRFINAEVLGNQVGLWRRETLGGAHADTLVSVSKLARAWDELGRH